MLIFCSSGISILVLSLIKGTIMKKILIIDSIYEKHFSDLQIEKDILHGYDLDLLHVKSLMDIPISLLSQADALFYGVVHLVLI